MAALRELAPDLPVWITETSVPAEGAAAHLSPEWQARMVVGVYGAFLAEGADRVFWHTLTDPPVRAGPSGFGTNSLFWNLDLGGSRQVRIKPAGEVYRRLAEVLADIDPASLRELPAEGGRLLETDRGWLVFDGTVAPPAEASRVLDLLTGAEAPVDGPVAAPAWLE